MHEPWVFQEPGSPVGSSGRALEPATVHNSLVTPTVLATSEKALTTEIQQLKWMIDDSASSSLPLKISLGSNLNVILLQQVMTFCPVHHGSGEEFIFLPARAYLPVLV